MERIIFKKTQTSQQLKINLVTFPGNRLQEIQFYLLYKGDFQKHSILSEFCFENSNN